MERPGRSMPNPHTYAAELAVKARILSDALGPDLSVEPDRSVLA